MSTSTLRVLIVIAAIALGVVFLREAFPGTTRASSRHPRVPRPVTLPSESPTPSPTPSESPSPSPSSSPKKKKEQKPQVAGVVVQVLNGTHTNGLATQISERLKAAGYTLEPAGNHANQEKTTIYYQPAHKIDADYLRKKQFPDADLTPAPATFPKKIDITVLLGLDFSA
ncbi:MAG TPA: LytR C-terminal domain-containing protein [Actinomycetota bacterium]|jgi:hypothetical protein